MGYYIETGASKGKAKWLRDNAKATSAKLPIVTDGSLIPVIVVDNGPFEAAAVAFNKRELDAFTSPSDHRPREILLIPKAEVLRLCPAVADALAW